MDKKFSESSLSVLFELIFVPTYIKQINDFILRGNSIHRYVTHYGHITVIRARDSYNSQDPKNAGMPRSKERSQNHLLNCR